ncbi:hypothetical protein H4R18_005446 [Coemansia javaensis]|uniref:Uncharacterized protein n=1 Tax=Coemansia javaensis TaxID=2761396 RepID=A0A9W8H5Y6_9FUNG|nr:hypothetical protein H4R18_005446 [Coemansia javaensis]
MAEAGPESEAQRRRRLRQERILNRGGDRLSRIKGTFSQAQAEAGAESGELAVAGGHELKTAAAAHTAGISLEALEGEAQPRRRAGNLARKARLEAAANDSSGAEASPRPEPRARPAVEAADINSNALHDTVTAAIADPAGDMAPAAAAAGEGRRFSAGGLARAAVRLAPTAAVFVYGLRREAAHERLLGDSAADVRAKWAGLLRARPDARLDEWAGGSHLLWYVIVVEAALYGAYLALSDRRQRPGPSALLAAAPAWAAALAPAAGRILDGLALLLLLTAGSIMAA